MSLLTDLPVQDLEYMFADELWDDQIIKDYIAGKFDRFIQEQQGTPAEFAEVLIKHFWELV